MPRGTVPSSRSFGSEAPPSGHLLLSQEACTSTSSLCSGGEESAGNQAPPRADAAHGVGGWGGHRGRWVLSGSPCSLSYLSARGMSFHLSCLSFPISSLRLLVRITHVTALPHSTHTHPGLWFCLCCFLLPEMGTATKVAS